MKFSGYTEKDKGSTTVQELNIYSKNNVATAY